MRRGLLVVFVAIMSAGCSSNSGPRFDKTDVDNINRLIEDLKTAFNAKDSAKAAALYSTTGVVMPPNKPIMRGRQFVEQYYKDRFQKARPISSSPRWTSRARARWRMRTAIIV